MQSASNRACVDESIAAPDKRLEKIREELKAARAEYRDIENQIFPGPDDTDDEQPPTDYLDLLEERISQLERDEMEVVEQRDAELTTRRFVAMAQAAYEPRVQSLRQVESRLGWAATASIAALGSLGVAGRLDEVPPALSTGLALWAFLTLMAILTRYTLAFFLYGAVELAGRYPAIPGQRRRAHRLGGFARALLPAVPAVFLLLEIATTVVLVGHWLLIIAELSAPIEMSQRAAPELGEILP